MCFFTYIFLLFFCGWKDTLLVNSFSPCPSSDDTAACSSLQSTRQQQWFQFIPFSCQCSCSMKKCPTTLFLVCHTIIGWRIENSFCCVGLFWCLNVSVQVWTSHSSAHKNPISRALYKAALSWWLEMRQNGKFNWKTGKQKEKRLIHSSLNKSVWHIWNTGADNEYGYYRCIRLLHKTKVTRSRIVVFFSF